jgi:Putative Actinobacterial Holin-X, holin superfamily III
MRIRASENGLGGAAKQVADHATSIARLEVELAVIELKRKVISLALGIGLAVAAAVLAFFMLGFGLATIAAALATVVSTWLALLIVAAGLAGLAGLLALLAIGRLRKGAPPIPEQAIREAKLTTSALKR